MNIKRMLIISATVALLQGCVAAAVVGVASGVTIASDNRSFGNFVDDNKIELDAHAKLSRIEGIADNTNLQVVSMNGKALIVGQAPNTYLKDLALKTVGEVEGVDHIYDQIRIGNKTSLATRSNDVWLTSKVKAALFGDEKLNNAINVKVVTENGEVFLLGLVKANDANLATDIARHVNGVNRVIKLFEIID